MFPENPSVINVAAHIRLGDSIGVYTRNIPLYWYRQVFDIITDLYPQNVHFYIFTSEVKQNNTLHLWLNQTFYDGKYQNLTLKIDNEQQSETPIKDLFVTMSHLITADIFITAKSSFSMVPAFYNTKCVIYTPLIRHPKENWIEVPYNKSDPMKTAKILYQQLPNCIQQVKGIFYKKQ
jgi:hypothetical protein